MDGFIIRLAKFTGDFSTIIPSSEEEAEQI
jgi:hypothetical protein